MATTTFNGMFVSGEIDMVCPKCGAYDHKRSFDFSKAMDGKEGVIAKEEALEAAYSGMLVDCPSCGTLMEIYQPNQAPAGHMKKTYHEETSAMQRSFRQRFMKGPEIDDVRHKFGRAIDDSLVAGEAKRIREGLNK